MIKLVLPKKRKEIYRKGLLLDKQTRANIYTCVDGHKGQKP